MKLKMFFAVLVSLLLVIFVSCDKDQPTDVGSDLSSDSSEESIESSSDESSSEESSSEESSSEESSSEESSSEESSSEESSSESEPAVRPGPDVTDEDLTLFADGKTDYTIVYPVDSLIIETLVKQLVSDIKKDFGVEIPYKAVDPNSDICEKEIIVDFVRTNAFYASYEMRKTNDFVFDVYGDDYVICATSEGMYPYAFQILKDEVLSLVTDGSFTVKPEDEYIYSDSDYRGISFADYLAKGNAFNQEILCQLFVNMSYTAKDGTTIPYRLYIPSDYDPLKEYPFLLFLHGAGERGNNNYSHMNHVIHDLFNQKDSPFKDAIIICPQCPSNNQWVDTPWANGNYSINAVAESNELKAVREIIDELEYFLSMDSDRYYAMGISMGGFGTWDLIMRTPDLFAAAVPICGGADVSMADTLKDFPIYTAHASNDYVVPYSGTSAMVEALRALGSDIIFKCHADRSLSSGGHLIWSEIARSTEMSTWLFSKSKG